MSFDLLEYRNRFEASYDLLRDFPQLETITIKVEESGLGEVARTTHVYDGKEVLESRRCGEVECINGRLCLASLVRSVLEAMTEGEQAQQCRRIMCSGELPPVRQRSRPCSYCYCITVTTTYRNDR